jgi:predicted transcriptional regulator
MRGALKKWKDSITKTQTIKVSGIKSVQKKLVSKDKLPKDVESILLYFFTEPFNSTRTLLGIMENFHYNQQIARYYVETLFSSKMIFCEGQLKNKLDCYSLTPKGRRYVMTNKLLTIEQKTSL